MIAIIAGCIDSDLPAGRRNFGQSDKPLIEIAHVHHTMWVTLTETRCNTLLIHREFTVTDYHPDLGALTKLPRKGHATKRVIT